MPSIKCINGHVHDSVAAVKACSTTQRSAAPQSARKQGGPTPKQENYIRKLLEEVGKQESDLTKPLAEYNMAEASSLIDGLLAERATKPREKNPTKGMKPNVAGKGCLNGTYTVVFDEATDDRITLRFRIPTFGTWKGVQLVEYLYGPDNENDFVRCANAVAGGYYVWHTATGNSRVMNAITFLASEADVEQQRAAGEMYALASSRCWRCNRKLTVPASVHRGLGPDCAMIVGYA